jgi:hypothetical protein
MAKSKATFRIGDIVMVEPRAKLKGTKWITEAMLEYAGCVTSITDIDLYDADGYFLRDTGNFVWHANALQHVNIPQREWWALLLHVDDAIKAFKGMPNTVDTTAYALLLTVQAELQKHIQGGGVDE